MTDILSNPKSKIRTVKFCSSCGKPVGNQGVSSLTSWLFQETFCQCQLRDSSGAKGSKPTASGSLFGTEPGARDVFDLPDLGDEYEVLERIGKGGMGSVYKVRDIALDRFLAVKVLHDELKDDQQSVSRFEREAKAALKLMHTNLVPVFSYGTSRIGSPYLVMDYVDGESLESRLKNDSYLEVSTAIDIFIQICDALSHAHQHSIIHRDIKPGNIIITRQADGKSVAKLVDFGIAKLRSATGRETQNLTQTGDVFGSPHYMSPEQCLGFDLDSRSDIYSLGCVMYECLSGKSPFDGHNAVQLIAKHLSADAPPLRICDVSQGDKVNERLAFIVYKCLEKDPQNRYFSAELLAGELRQLTSEVSEKSGLVMPRKLNTLRTLFVINGIASLGAAGLFSFPYPLPYLLLLPATAAIIGALLLNERIDEFVTRTQFQSRAVKNAAGPCVNLLVICHWLLALCAGLAVITPFSPLLPAAYPFAAAGLGVVVMIVVWTGFQLDTESTDIQGSVTTGKVMHIMSGILLAMLGVLIAQFFAPDPTIVQKGSQPESHRQTSLPVTTLLELESSEKDLPIHLDGEPKRRISTREVINGVRYKVFQFPKGVNVGTILLHAPDRSISSHAAQGILRFPADSKLSLVLNAFSASNCAPLLRKFEPDDFNSLQLDSKSSRLVSANNIDDVLYFASNLSKLKELSLVGADMSEAGLRNLSNLKELEYLNLAGTTVDGKALAALPQLRQLRGLEVGGVKNAGAVVKALNRSAMLVSLGVYDTDLKKDEVLQITQFPNLRNLMIYNCSGVSDELFERLAEKSQLRYLNISCSMLTDKAIQSLKKVSSLRVIWLHDGKLPLEKDYQLKAALPNCTIEYRIPPLRPSL